MRLPRTPSPDQTAVGRRMWPVVLLLVCVPFAARPAAGQPVTPLLLSPDLAITQFIHDTWGVQDGLPQNSINAVLQTRNGYLWLGTQEGLVRFDGVTFTIFDRTHIRGLESNLIRVLAESTDGTLWIGTEGGLTSHRDGTFHTYTTADGLPGNVIRALHEDRNGHLWIGTLGNGLVRFDGTVFTTFISAEKLADPADGIILGIDELPDGSLLVGTASGLFRIRDEKVYPIPQSDRLPGIEVWSLLVEESGDAWLGTNDGLARLDDGVLVPLPDAVSLRGQTISTLKRDPAGSLWIGTTDAGLFRLSRGRLTAFDSRHGLTHDLIRSLFVDWEGSLWIGTDGGGLNRLRPGKFAPFRRSEGLSHDAVLTVMEDRSGALWVGTEGRGLDQVVDGRIRRFTTADGLASDYIYALHEDMHGRLWVGTTNGICRLEADRFQCFDTDDGLTGEHVYAIQEDHEGTLWIGTAFGANLLHDGRITSLPDEESLSHEMIRAIHTDRNGAVWFGTEGGGLYRRYEGRMERFRAAEGLTSDFVLSLFEDAEGVLWVGTKGGLCRRRSEAFQCLTTDAGLRSDKILQILDDQRGHLWLGNLSGIFQISKVEIEAYLAGTRTQVTTRLYDELDGLPLREANGGVQPPAWRARDGHLWFATLQGLARILPDEIAINRIPPPVTIEQVFVNGEAADLAAGDVFAPGSRDFTFHYTALSLAAPERVMFQFQLEGYDEHWIDAGQRRQAYYTNLKPGTYRFRVKASNNDGVWNETGATFTFHIEPHFYETHWFYLLCALVVVLMGLSLYRWRVHSLRTRQAELTQLVAEQTRELRQREQALQELNGNLECEVRRQLDLILEERSRYERELIHAKEKAEESARLKTAILRNMSHEIRTPITAILGFAHVLSEEVGSAQQEFVTYISENGRRLLNTLNSILDLAKLETDQVLLNLEALDVCTTVRESVTLLAPIARRKEIGLRAELPGHAVVAPLDRNGTERILQNLIGNAIKFTDEGEVVVSAGVHGDRVYLKVHDTGIGISEDFLPHLFEEFKQESTGLARSHEGSGLGLAITRRLVEALGGTIEVESAKFQGTTFTVTFPSDVPEHGAGDGLPMAAFLEEG